MRDRGVGVLEWVDDDHAVSDNGLVGVLMVHDERSAAPVANAAESLAEELGVERVVVVLCGENNTEVFDERELMLNLTQHVCSPRFKVLVPREVVVLAGGKMKPRTPGAAGAGAALPRVCILTHALACVGFT